MVHTTAKGVVLIVSMVLMLCAWGCASAVAEGTADEPEAGLPKVVSMAVSAEAIGPYAVTEVTSELENPFEEPIDHSFRFRIPEGALISNFSLTVEGVTYFADILEKEHAEEKFNASVAAGRTAGLVASYGDQLFSYGISFAPYEVITVSLRYEQILLRENGWYTYELNMAADGDPLTVGHLGVMVNVASLLDIEEHEESGYEGLLASVQTSRRDLEVILDAYDIAPTENIKVRWRTLGGSLEGQMLFAEREGMGYFVHVFAPDPSIVSGDRLPKDFVFILDKSGSMRGTKFDQSKEALEFIYSSLSNKDRFSFVEFNSDSTVYSEELLEAKQTEKDNIFLHIEGLSAGGSTNIHAGVMDSLDIFKAAGDAVPVIVLLSDGKANTGLYARSDFRQDVQDKNTVDASIYCIALGDGADWTFLEALALENHGQAIWVHESEDVVAMISDFVRSFSMPLLADLSFEYAPYVTDVYPAEVRAHYLGSEVLVAGRFPAGTWRIHTTVSAMGSHGTLTSSETFDVQEHQMEEFVPRFWAFQRIRSLEELMKYNGTDNATIDEIIDLAMEFHFATDYTSLYVELPEDLQERFGTPEPQLVGLDASEDGLTSIPFDLAKGSSSGSPSSGGSAYFSATTTRGSQGSSSLDSLGDIAHGSDGTDSWYLELEEVDAEGDFALAPIVLIGALIGVAAGVGLLVVMMVRSKGPPKK